MRKLVVIISEKNARAVLLASACTSVSGAVRKAMGVLTAQVRTRSYTAAGALEDLDRAMGGWVVKLRMIGDRSSELAQSLTDLIVLFYSVFFPYRIHPCV